MELLAHLIISGMGDCEFVLENSDGLLVGAGHGLHIVEECTNAVVVVWLVDQVHAPLLTGLLIERRLRLRQLVLEEMGLLGKLLELGLVLEG